MQGSYVFGTFQLSIFFDVIEILISNNIEIHETRNISERNRRFGASSAVIKVT